MTTIHTIVHNGRIEFDAPVEIPEGSAVEIRLRLVEQASGSRTRNAQSPPIKRTLAEQFADFVGTAPDLPEDLAENHDHYVHGYAQVMWEMKINEALTGDHHFEQAGFVALLK